MIWIEPRRELEACARMNCWQLAAQADPLLVKLGGGPRDITVRKIEHISDRAVPGAASGDGCARRDGRERDQHRFGNV